MAPQHQAGKPKEVVQARIDPDALARLDALAKRERRSRSELIDFAVLAYVDQHAPDAAGRAKPKK